MKRIFLGLILGELVVGGFWVVVDYFTGMRSAHLTGVVFEPRREVARPVNGSWLANYRG